MDTVATFLHILRIGYQYVDNETTGSILCVNILIVASETCIRAMKQREVVFCVHILVTLIVLALLLLVRLLTDLFSDIYAWFMGTSSLKTFKLLLALPVPTLQYAPQKCYGKATSKLLRAAKIQ